MAYKSSIEWTESTWNPVTGCSKISEGCLNCYAGKLALRLKAMGQSKYKNGFKVTLHSQALSEPLKLNKSEVIFVCSMSDIFHNEVPDEYIMEIFNVMNRADKHIFQVLTKRADRLEKIVNKVKWTDNIWMGVTIESSNYLSRASYLNKTPAKIKFLSLEPLLGPMHDLPLTDINWVIVGGESGPRSRIVETEWIQEVKNKCIDSDVPFFFKQWGGINKKKNGRMLDGRIWDEMPKLNFPRVSASLF